MRPLKNWAALVAAFLCLWMNAVAATERPDVAKRVVAYQGEQGVKVWTLRIGERSANQALVQVEGVDHDWDMRIQKMQVEKTDKDTRYVTTVDGHRFVALIVQGVWGGELYLPGQGQPLQVGYSEGLSSQGNPDAFLTDYLDAAQ